MIRLHEVSYEYPKRAGFRVLDQISLHIEKGEYVSIVGANGSGKSTLAKLLCGLIQPTSGRIELTLNEGERDEQTGHFSGIGYVFQNPEHQIIAPTVYEDVAFGLQNIGVETAEINERIHSALSAVDLIDYRDAEVMHLSGGQKQRVAIAGILAMMPAAIVFDESSSMLDPIGREQLRKLKSELHERGIAIISITHWIDEVLDSSRIIALKSGKIWADGSLLDVLASMSDDSHWPLPFPVEMRLRLKENGIEVPDSVITLEQLVASLNGNNN